MPPRFAFWTIIIDDAPTAFRARDRADLVPTLRQLQARNPNATIKWFSRGKLWESPEEARAAARHGANERHEASGAPGAGEPAGVRRRPAFKRSPDWRPGGRHEDPRARFRKKAHEAGGSGGAGGASKRASPPHGSGERSSRERRPDWRQKRREERPSAPRHASRKNAQHWKDRDRRRRPLPRGVEPPGTNETPGKPEPPPPGLPPGPDRPPKPGHEPGPDVPTPETIKILPEPPERAKKR